MARKEKTWLQAIDVVLEASNQPMHYTEITDEIIRGELRKSLGATPAATVNANISWSIKHDGDKSPYVRIERGSYFLRKNLKNYATAEKAADEEDSEETLSFINSFGMYWSRLEVDWSKNTPKLLGVQKEGAKPVDFSHQLGVYILYDGHRPVYVGRSTNRPLGKRLYEHTTDRLRGRWSRFSWFGVIPVTEEGKLQKTTTVPSDPEAIISTLEALLIEAVEPSQNRKRGDDFNAIEYLQVEDPELAIKKQKRLLTELMMK